MAIQREASHITLQPLAGKAGPGDETGYTDFVGPIPMNPAVIYSEPASGKAMRRDLPSRAREYPKLRFMGSKHRLLPWLHEVFSRVEFDTALDAFSGTGCVAYLLKSMGKEVTTNDFLQFASLFATALIENSEEVLEQKDVDRLLATPAQSRCFIERTSSGIFFTPTALRFLDQVWANLWRLRSPYRKALALSALIRSCIKRQPRGVFTVVRDPQRYQDGLRDLRLSLRDHFIEQVDVLSRTVFNSGRRSRALHGDVFAVEPDAFDLVYMDPPYVPRADDNCYIKRYHFLEGLCCYWEGLTILEDSRVKKLQKRYTPFSYRRQSVDAFDRLFARFRKSILVLSYSSNGYPDLDDLLQLMSRYKSSVSVFETDHRYHFGNHSAVQRSMVKEYLILGV